VTTSPARTLRVAIALVALVLAVAAEAATAGATAGERPAPGGHEPLGVRRLERVRMVDGNRFRPANLQIDRGTRVRWINRDNVTHTTTSNDGRWDRRLAPGERFTRRFRRAGEFPYRCTIHVGMTGRIVVS
jgi:plastocyanin